MNLLMRKKSVLNMGELINQNQTASSNLASKSPKPNQNEIKESDENRKRMKSIKERRDRNQKKLRARQAQQAKINENEFSKIL